MRSKLQTVRVEACALLETEATVPLRSIWSLLEALPGLSPVSARLFPSQASTASSGRKGEFVCLLAFVLFRGFC